MRCTGSRRASCRNAAGSCSRPIMSSKVWCTSSVRGDELPGAHGAAVGQRDAGRLAAFDHDAVDLDLRLRSVPPAAMKVSISAARQVERAALAELVAALQVEGADHRAHRAGLRQRVDQPGAEQRDLEQEQELHVLVLEQLLDHVERLAPGHRQEIAADRAAATAAPRARPAAAARRTAPAGRSCAVISSALRFQSRKVCASFLEKRATLASVSSRSRPKHQRRAVEMRLAELVARRDVGRRGRRDSGP